MLRIYRVSEGARQPHDLAIGDVSQVLLSGGLALVPTETVYGIGVTVGAYSIDGSGSGLVPGGSTGYGRMFALKQRDVSQTVPWLVAGEEDLDAYGEDVDERTRVLARAFWPGALTLVVRASKAVPAFMRAADGTVALRASASPVVQALIQACGSPLAVTSANTHGAPAPAAFADVEPRVLRGVDVAVDAGRAACCEASTIVSFAHGGLEVIREGALSSSQIERSLNRAAACS